MKMFSKLVIIVILAFALHCQVSLADRLYGGACRNKEEIGKTIEAIRDMDTRDRNLFDVTEEQVKRWCSIIGKTKDDLQNFVEPCLSEEATICTLTKPYGRNSYDKCNSAGYDALCSTFSYVACRKQHVNQCNGTKFTPCTDYGRCINNSLTTGLRLQLHGFPESWTTLSLLEMQGIVNTVQGYCVGSIPDEAYLGHRECLIKLENLKRFAACNVLLAYYPYDGSWANLVNKNLTNINKACCEVERRQQCAIDIYEDKCEAGKFIEKFFDKAADPRTECECSKVDCPSSAFAFGISWLLLVISIFVGTYMV